MVREVTFKVYQFDELSEEVKEKVLDDCRFIMVEYFNWWEFVYEDAENIGLEIVEFDLDRRYIRMKLKENILSSIEEALLSKWQREANKWLVTIYYKDRSMTIPYFTGLGYKGNPVAYNELNFTSRLDKIRQA